MTQKPPVRCIVADDHAATRQGVTEILSAQGDIEVVATASDGPEAVHLMQHYRPDVAVIDVLMPGKGGLDVVKEVQDSGLGTVIVIYSGYPDPEVVRACTEAGAKGFVLKSAPAEELLRAVRTVAAGDAYIDATALEPAPAESGNERSLLSKREREVLQLLANGRTNDETAQEVGLSPATVRTYLRSVYVQLGVRNKIELGGALDPADRARR